MKKEGDKAPPLTLQNVHGEEINIDTQRPCVLYFYPKAGTPGCTTEAKAFSETYPEFNDIGVPVYGVSPDSVEDVCSFQDDHGFKHELLADPKNNAAETYGVWGKKQMFGNEYYGVTRSTFLLDEGTVVKAWKHKPDKTEQQVLQATKNHVQ